MISSRIALRSSPLALEFLSAHVLLAGQLEPAHVCKHRVLGHHQLVVREFLLDHVTEELGTATGEDDVVDVDPGVADLVGQHETN